MHVSTYFVRKITNRSEKQNNTAFKFRIVNAGVVKKKNYGPTWFYEYGALDWTKGLPLLAQFFRMLRNIQLSTTTQYSQPMNFYKFIVASTQK